MPRGEVQTTKVHHQGQEDDFLIFVDDQDSYKKWKTDSTIPMSDFVSAFKVFVTHKQGAQGQYDTASKSSLENEFGTSNVDDVIKIILEKGTMQNTKMPERQGDRNISQGGTVAHG